MAIFTVDKEKCQKDGICAAVCPRGLIEFTKNQPPRPVAKADELCLNCGHCLAACPNGALSLAKMPVAGCPPVNSNLALTPEHAEHFLRSRRSIRVFRPQPVPRDQITRLIEIARFAPSGHNAQPVRWMVFSDAARIERLAGLVIDWMREKIAQHDEMVKVLDMEHWVGQWEAGRDVILRKAPVLIVTHGLESLRTQCASIIALAYLELAAPSLGLGGCWAGFLNAAANDFKPLEKELALPAGHKTYGSMMLGYPRYAYHRLPLRNKPPIAWR